MKKKNSFFVHAPFVMIVMVLLVVSALVFSDGFCVSAVDQASSSLAKADRAVGEAFGAVSEAQQAGANVTGLLTRLNEAAGLLAQAEIAYRNGAANTATNKANGVLSIASEVSAAAVDAKETAVVTSRNAFWITLAFSVEGAIIFALALFLVWLRYKKSYVKDLFDAKPEVNGQ